MYKNGYIKAKIIVPQKGVKVYKKIVTIASLLFIMGCIEIKTKYHNFSDKPDEEEILLPECDIKVDEIKKSSEKKPSKKIAHKKTVSDKNILKEQDREERRKKRQEAEVEKNAIIKSLRKDDTQELKKLMAKNSKYDWNSIRSGIWGLEDTTGLVDSIYYNAVHCLRYLIKNNFINKKGLTTKCGNGFYPLDYALNPVQDEILDMLLDKFEKLKINPTDFINPKYKNEYKLYLKRKSDFYKRLQGKLT
jgi:hypothetical protein